MHNKVIRAPIKAVLGPVAQASARRPVARATIDGRDLDPERAEADFLL
jgi:hypothetical protein